jgi:hypothetical protein
MVAVIKSRLPCVTLGVVHYDGTKWTTQLSGTIEYLTGVWGTGPTDVFAVGGSPNLFNASGPPGAILHYDGVSWASTAGAATGLNRVGGSAGAPAVFAVGPQGLLLVGTR